MRITTVSAPGKLHLLGEHSVVYGKPAIIAAVDKRCYITVTERKDEKIVITVEENSYSTTESFTGTFPFASIFPSAVGDIVMTSPTAEETKGRVPRSNIVETTIEKIIKKTQKAQEIWKEYKKTNDITKLQSFILNPFDFISLAIGEVFLYYKKSSLSGLSFSVRSEIPIGSGMGSSAALAVSLAGAITEFLGEPFDKEKINEIAFRIEQKKHANPSGGDNAASCYGGLIWYQKKSGQVKNIIQFPFSLPKNLVEKFTIINTGMPDESTGEMVTQVKIQNSKFKSKFENIFTVQERLVNDLVSAIEKSDEKELIRIIQKGEKNLEELGVVSKSAKQLIREIENLGGAAKICGAGGKKSHSGIVLAFHKDPDTINDISNHFNFPCNEVVLGTEGVRIEK